MLLGRVSQFLCSQLLERTDDAETSVARLNYIIDVTILGSIVRIAEQVGVFLFLSGNVGFRIFLFFSFLHIEHFGSTGSTHHSNFCRRPCVVHIATQLLTAHHNVATAIALADCYGHLGHSGFAVGIKQFCAVKDNGIIFLSCPDMRSL